jgi:MFS family permease
MSGLLAPLRNTFRSLRHYNYRVWVAGAFVSNVGSWMQRTAQAWLVLTHLTDQNATAVGITLALQFGPALLLLPLTGLAADRYNQHRLLMITQAALGCLALTLGTLTLTGTVQLWHVYVLAFLQGCAVAFDSPVRQTFVGVLVGTEDLPNAVALNSTNFNAGRMIGPAAAGVLIATVGTGWSFIINGLSFGVVLFSLTRMRVNELRPSKRAKATKGGMFMGLGYALRRPELLGNLIMTFFLCTFGLNFPIFISTMSVSVFHTGPGGYGVLNSIMAIGSISGALFAAGREPRFYRMMISALVFSFGCTLAAFAPSYHFFAGTLILIGITTLTFTNTGNSLMQINTHPSMRGRVMALRMAVVMGCTPLGAPMVGWVADHMGPRWSLGVGAVAGLISAGVAFWFLRTGRVRWG